MKANKDSWTGCNDGERDGERQANLETLEAVTALNLMALEANADNFTEMIEDVREALAHFGAIEKIPTYTQDDVVSDLLAYDFVGALVKIVLRCYRLGANDMDAFVNGVDRAYREQATFPFPYQSMIHEDVILFGYEWRKLAVLLSTTVLMRSWDVANGREAIFFNDEAVIQLRAETMQTGTDDLIATVAAFVGLNLSLTHRGDTGWFEKMSTLARDVYERFRQSKHVSIVSLGGTNIDEPDTKLSADLLVLMMGVAAGAIPCEAFEQVVAQMQEVV